METKISSKEELYNKVLPALRTKKHELERLGLVNISEKIIWEYNKQNKWIKSTGLTLATMVDDILNTEDKEYIDFLINAMKKGDK